ncbi:hypothetical protein CAAN3_01S09340 [[Candida] anglica]
MDHIRPQYPRSHTNPEGGLPRSPYSNNSEKKEGNNMSYPLFTSPHTGGPSSPFNVGELPPPQKKSRTIGQDQDTSSSKFFLPTQRSNIEPNVSYTRSYSSNSIPSLLAGPTTSAGASASTNIGTENSATESNNSSTSSKSNHNSFSINSRPHQQRHNSVHEIQNSGPNTKVSSLSNITQSNGSNSQYRTVPISHLTSHSRSSIGSESDEDERFLRLAKEALVATAGAKGVANNLMVDPTIQDLLRRLQYASSPHGNPIKRSKKIHANENGQLQIQGFYKQFPNLSNNIFMESEGSHIMNSGANLSATAGNSSTITNGEDSSKSLHHPSNSRSEGWNFLVGEPMVYKTQNTRTAEDVEDEEDEDLRDEKDSSEEGGEESRKFSCEKCLMSFRRSSDLKRHEKQHLSIPPNICELCGKGFARKDALKRHMGTLTCKRNADKRLYIENLSYVNKRKKDVPGNGQSFRSNNNENDWDI